MWAMQDEDDELTQFNLRYIHDYILFSKVIFLGFVESNILIFFQCFQDLWCYDAGVYSVNVDADKGLAEIEGQVDRIISQESWQDQD